LKVPLPQFRFSIRQLAYFVAICALLFAVLRTPFGFLVLAIGCVLPGFWIGRARGGSGVLGGGLCASLIACALAIAGHAAFFGFAPPFGTSLSRLLHTMFYVSLSAFGSGACVSFLLSVVCELVGGLLNSPLRDDSIGPIQWQTMDEPSARPL
jgi:hypothetical protein